MAMHVVGAEQLHILNEPKSIVDAIGKINEHHSMGATAPPCYRVHSSRSLLSVVRRPSSVIRHPSSIVRRPSSVVRHPSSVVSLTHCPKIKERLKVSGTSVGKSAHKRKDKLADEQ
jgi:hypothetical protein